MDIGEDAIRELVLRSTLMVYCTTIEVANYIEEVAMAADEASIAQKVDSLNQFLPSPSPAGAKGHREEQAYSHRGEE
jgi:hypothetical protein